MQRITEVVKHLLIINVLIFVAKFLVPQNWYELLPLYYPGVNYPGDVGFKPFQLVTSMFTHASEGHIFFNMLSLFFLGPMVEMRMGQKKFLIFYLVCGFGATLAHMLMIFLNVIPPHPVVGASGAIMGVFAAFAYFFPDLKLMLLIPPVPIKAKYLILILVAVDLFSGVGGFRTGIAHFAHLGGALVGFVLLMLWKNNQSIR